MWLEAKLGDVIDIKHGWAFKGKYFSEEPTEDIILTPGNFKIGGGFKYDKLKYYAGEFPSEYLLREGDIVVTMTDLSVNGDTLGYAAKIPSYDGKRFLLNQRIGLVKIKSKDVFPDYIYWVMRTRNYQSYVASTSRGATVKHTSPTLIREYEFSIPRLTTQRKIAGILSAYDDLIENNLKRIKLLEEEALCHYELLIKSKTLHMKNLMLYGKIITGKTPSTKNSRFYGADVPFIKTPDMHNQIFIENTQQSLSSEGANSQTNQFIPSYSLCVSCIGTAGVIGITSKVSQTNQQINSIVFSNSDYVYYFYCAMKNVKEQLEALGSNGATFTNVNKSKFENMTVLCPDEEAMLEYAGNVKHRFALMLNLQRQNNKLREARDILLPKLMSDETLV
mgnify:CR=1 FL=1